MMKNEVLQNIVTRRSIRKYKQTQIKEEELETVLEAGTYAPSGRGMQCPILVAVQAPDTMAKIVKMNAQVLGFRQESLLRRAYRHSCLCAGRAHHLY